MHFESILGTINSYTKQRIEKALENYYELASASAGFRDRRVGDGGRCVRVHEVLHGVVGVVVGVGVVGGGRDNRCVQHGEVDGRYCSGTRAALPALDGDGSPLPRHHVRKW